MSLPGSVITSRRQTMGLALLSMAGLHQATTTEGKNRKKKKKDKCDRKVERAVAEACGRQIPACVAGGTSFCDRAADVPACLATLRQCCDFFGQCDTDSYTACIEENIVPLTIV